MVNDYSTSIVIYHMRDHVYVCLCVCVPFPRPSSAWIGSGSMSESESTRRVEGAVVSNAVLLRVSTRREAVLRDMLAFSSDGECMDGPQVCACVCACVYVCACVCLCDSQEDDPYPVRVGAEPRRRLRRFGTGPATLFGGQERREEAAHLHASSSTQRIVQ